MLLTWTDKQQEESSAPKPCKVEQGDHSNWGLHGVRMLTCLKQDDVHVYL